MDIRIHPRESQRLGHDGREAEAAIAAEHCSAPDFASTRWEEIDRYYGVLETMKDNPVIGLNRAVILSQIEGPIQAIKKLNELKAHPRLQGYYLLHATLGELYVRSGRPGALFNGNRFDYIHGGTGLFAETARFHCLK